MDHTRSLHFRWLLVRIIFAFAALSVCNGMIRLMARNSVPRQVLRSLQQPGRVDGLALGDSLIQAGFREAAFDSSWTASHRPAVFLNAGLGASSAVEHLLLFRQARRDHPEIRTVIYGFFDRKLTERPSGGCADLTGNRAISYYVEPYFAAEMYAPASRLNHLQMSLVGQVPMLVERLTLWAKVERFRRLLETVGMPGQVINRFGRTGDFAALESNSSVEFSDSCRVAVQQHLPLTPAIDEMLRECSISRPRVRVVVVCMPASPEHRRIFYQQTAWSEYRNYVRHLVEQRGCVFVDASDWIVPQDRFVDHLHLGPLGADEFTRRLAEEMLERGITPAS